MKNARFYWLGLLLLGLFSCSDDEQIEHGLLRDCLNHYQAQSYLVATSTCQEAAEYGNVEAQWLLANILYYDLGENGSASEDGFDWFIKAAEGGWTDAQTFVGECYMYAETVEQDYDKAYRWLSKAAKRYDADAEFAIGVLFNKGFGRKQDLSSAISWYKKAANQSHSMSINNLAWIHATSSHKAFRSAKKALFWATKLDLDSNERLIFLDTKAAAHALAEEFDIAISLQNEVISLLPQDIDENDLLAFQQRLEAYQSKLPWQEAQ